MAKYLETVILSSVSRLEVYPMIRKLYRKFVVNICECIVNITAVSLTYKVMLMRKVTLTAGRVSCLASNRNGTAIIAVPFGRACLGGGLRRRSHHRSISAAGGS